MLFRSRSIFAFLNAGVAYVVLMISKQSAKSWLVIAAWRARLAVSTGMAALMASGSLTSSGSRVLDFESLGMGFVAYKAKMSGKLDG